MIRNESFKIIDKDKLNKFANDLAKLKFEDLPYIIEYYNKNYHAIKLNLRSTFQNINFTYEKDTPIKAAIIFFKNFLNNSTSKLENQAIDTIPTDFIPNRMKSYVINKKDKFVDRKDGKKIKYVNSNLYETILYIEVEKAIDSKIFISESESYRSLEEELIPLEAWDRDKEVILSNLTNCVVSLPFEEILQPLETKLEGLYATVNARIQSGENKYIKIDTKNSKWKLPYEKQDEEVNNPLFDKMPMIDLVDVISYVAEQTGFMEYFTHILSKDVKSSARLEHVIAYMIGSGTGLGKGRIAESSDVTKSELDTLERNFIRLETLKNASNSIINKIAELDIFKHFNLSEYGTHASIDGQKLTTRYQTATARYSTKYYGTTVGVVSLSLIANHLPINSIIISPNNHESQYLVDMYLNNSSNIKPIAISGDMHSVNRFNGGLLNLLKCQFMPRFTKIYKTSTTNLIGFKDKSQYEKLLIKPASQADKSLMKNEWNSVMRIVASLAMKQSSQNVIIRKLLPNKGNSTLKALTQYDKIVMSIYLLNYIDDINVRRIVQRALNRGEAFHQLRSALMKISGKQLQGRTEFELAISNEANRFLACCIIYYNCVLLSFLLGYLDQKKDKDLYELITRLSPVAWQHINMIGKFQFLQNKKAIDLKSVINDLLDELKKSFKPLRSHNNPKTKSSKTNTSSNNKKTSQ
jgi:TnpA family transposase